MASSKRDISSKWLTRRRDLLLAIRGELTQANVNKRLGLSFNQVYRWEAGLKRMLWSEFVDYCDACSRPLKAVCKEVLFFSGPVKRGDRLIRHLLIEDRLRDFAKRYGISLQIATRWRAGHSEPTLEGVLQAVEFRMRSLTPFLTNLVDLKNVADLGSDADLGMRQRNLVYEHPAIAMILAALHLKNAKMSKRRDLAFFQELIPGNPAYVQALIGKACDVELIKEVDGIYETTRRILDVRGDAARLFEFHRYWHERAGATMQKLEREEPGSHFPTIVFPSDEPTRAKVLELIGHFFAGLTRHLETANKTDTDRVEVLQIAHFAPVDAPSLHS